jgi:hypothetical protein
MENSFCQKIGAAPPQHESCQIKENAARQRGWWTSAGQRTAFLESRGVERRVDLTVYTET